MESAIAHARMGLGVIGDAASLAEGTAAVDHIASKLISRAGQRQSDRVSLIGDSGIGWCCLRVC